jgi:hypothetical protein
LLLLLLQIIPLYTGNVTDNSVLSAELSDALATEIMVGPTEEDDFQVVCGSKYDQN